MLDTSKWNSLALRKNKLKKKKRKKKQQKKKKTIDTK